MFDQRNVSFSAVTQQINSTTSMGRLMLNVLLSFAQFEREVIGECIRDKIAASKRKGMWMGGVPPLGYDVENRRLVPNEREAKLIRHIFQRFVELGSSTALVKELKLHLSNRTRIVKLLVEKVIVSPNDLEVRLRANGIERLVLELRPEPAVQQAEALA